MTSNSPIPGHSDLEGGAAAAPDPPFGADDPDPFMLPLEAAQLVVLSSRGAIGLDEARVELERALAEGLLSLIGQRQGSYGQETLPPNTWAHHRLELLPAATSPKGELWAPVWTDLLFRRGEMLALWPDDLLTLDEAG